jgi:uncharacterized protein
MNLRQFAERHPILCATLCAALQFAITILILKLGKTYAPPQAYGKVKLLAFASTVLLPLLMVQLFGMWREVGLGVGKASPFLLACLLPVAMFASMGVKLPDAGLGGDLAIQLFNAFGEELLFRGVIFVILLRLRQWQAIVINGLLFGSMHLIHGYMDGNWVGAFQWMLMSAMAGMMFTAARYRVQSLWWLVALHMVLNLASMYSNVETVAGPVVNHMVQYATKAVEVVLALYVIVTSRRQQPILKTATV